MTARILQLTDLHVFGTADTRLKGIPTRESLIDVVNYVTAHEQDFDAVIITGDHTHDELLESYEAVRSILSPWLDRLWQVPGNHDDRTILRRVFSERISGDQAAEITFHFELEGWSLIGLDTHWPTHVAGQFHQEQADWLENELKRTRAARVALFLHHPPVDIGSVWMDAIGLNGRELLLEVIAADTRVQVAWCGHVHHDFQSRVGQMLVQATPSTGIQFDPAGDLPNFSSAAPGYRVIELNGGHFESRVVRLPEAKYTPEHA